MNQTNQQHYKLLKQKVFEIYKKEAKKKTCVLNGFNEGKNYNPMKHCK